MKKDSTLSFKNLCNTCQDHSCCTTFASPLIFNSDLLKIKSVTNEKFFEFIKVNDKKMMALTKKKDSSSCHFWDSKVGCRIYQHRPLECRMFPFDIHKIDNEYRWVVYTCNPNSDWQWAESYLQMLETDPVFPELMENIEEFTDLSRMEENSGEIQYPYKILRRIQIAQSKIS